MKACLVSMDSTLRKNLSVGLLVVLLVYSWDTLKDDVHHRSAENDSYFINLKARWS